MGFLTNILRLILQCHLVTWQCSWQCRGAITPSKVVSEGFPCGGKSFDSKELLQCLQETLAWREETTFLEVLHCPQALGTRLPSCSHQQPVKTQQPWSQPDPASTYCRCDQRSTCKICPEIFNANPPSLSSYPAQVRQVDNSPHKCFTIAPQQKLFSQVASERSFVACVVMENRCLKDVMALQGAL